MRFVSIQIIPANFKTLFLAFFHILEGMMRVYKKNSMWLLSIDKEGHLDFQ